jgi:hypothetical protein
MVDYLKKEDMEYTVPNLDDTKFHSHRGETFHIQVYLVRSINYGWLLMVLVWINR